MKPVLSTLRSEGITCVSFLDDCLIIGRNEKACQQHVTFTTSLYTKLGLSVNREKSQLVPAKRVKFLGLIFDTNKCTLVLPQDKAKKVVQKCNHLLQEEFVTIQLLAELVGTLVSVCPAVPYGTLYTKQLEFEKSIALKRNHNDYSKCIKLSSLGVKDLHWWSHKALKRCKEFGRVNYDLEITTDSSLT